jgi:hypothetical protein
MNLALAVNILIAILGPHIAGAIVFSPHEEKGKEAIMPGLPFVVSQGHQPSAQRRAQFVRVLDAATRSPITDATVKVRMRRSSTIIFKQGLTNAQGLFVFTFAEAHRWAPIFIFVDAPGFWGVNDEARLDDERVITLFRKPESGQREFEREEALRTATGHCGRLLSWPI